MSCSASSMSIHADTTELQARWTDRQTAFQLYIVDRLCTDSTKIFYESKEISF